MEMSHSSSNGCCLFLVVLLILSTLSQTSSQANNVLKTSTFLSPKFELQPGSVENKIYYNIDFPKGHIAVKRFDAEVVDEAGNSVPLHETYMHHWLVARYYIRKGVENPKYHSPDLGFHQSDFIMVKNSGLCGNGLVQYFGLGSETRKTDTHIPDPYGIEVGNVEEVPEGYEEGWLLNVHAIDTRGAVDKLGCTECRCGLYNVTVDEHGKAIERDYIGGLRCCADGTRCRVKKGFESGKKRGLYLKYNVTYVEWDDSSSIVPVKIYIFDVTDTWGKMDGTTKVPSKGHNCKIEYDVPICPSNVDKENCIHTQSAVSSLPTGGDVIYAVSHQHTGGVGSVLYGEDGRTLCSSHPMFCCLH
ncbi:unnamed protein product [Cuscuta campestris]|uniref:Stress up-regulated Nod 19 protein n=1 Tax=Cuscuta campestris TaxID=132261 RepID=A0A484MGI3_9ASTE|nr:unnamed protein product [Cuscuta campestris]